MPLLLALQDTARASHYGKKTMKHFEASRPVSYLNGLPEPDSDLFARLPVTAPLEVRNGAELQPGLFCQITKLVVETMPLPIESALGKFMYYLLHLFLPSNDRNLNLDAVEGAKSFL